MLSAPRQGGFDAIRSLISGLPADLDASIFIVWHMSPDVRGILPHVLNKNGKLKAGNALNHEAIAMQRCLLFQWNSLLKDTTVSDLYILDKQLSGIDGLDLCRMLKNRDETRHVPVIILSASPNINELANAAGADAVVEKPFELKHFARPLTEG